MSLQNSLFDDVPDLGPELGVGKAITYNDDWRPEDPPDLSQTPEIVLNVETTGLRWWAGDRPIAISIYANERSWYLPFGHRGNGNLDEEAVKRWAKEQLRGKYIRNINSRFDNHQMYAWGVDLEAQGNRWSDVGHYAALLDDHRLRMNLDSLIVDYLHETPMQRLDESRMASYTAGMAQARARYNVEAVHRLTQVMWPMLDEQELQKVRELEDKVIYVVCEMERNGTRIDQDKLAQWIVETQKRFQKDVMDLYRMTGLKVDPGVNKDIVKLFKHCNIAITEFTATGGASFTDEVIKAHAHPAIKLLRHARKMASLHSKLKKYSEAISSDGILRYALHQLRAAKSEGDDAGETGTVTGRFTSTEIARGEGTNIQQVMKPEKQFLIFGNDEFFIRDLHIPEPGQLHMSSDAEQIQYRLFANEAKNPEVLAAYAKDPWSSFHRITLEKLRKQKPDLPYRRCKDVNFAKMFAAGPSKLALMLDFITKAQYEELKAARANRYHPLLKSTLEILKIYDKEMPEVDELLRKASKLAEDRGYIKTILGRRMRFPHGYRLHKALNGRIQGSEADIVKTKAVELHEARKYTGLRLQFQVHDEFDGCVPDEEAAKKVSEILNAQSFNLTVPILWGMKTGVTWGDCSRDEIEKMKKEAHR